jgi:hypothetical protein
MLLVLLLLLPPVLLLAVSALPVVVHCMIASLPSQFVLALG